MAALFEIFQRRKMRLGQVLHVDVIPDAGAVGGGVMIPEDADVIPLAEGGFHHQRDEVGFGVVILADARLGIGAGGIKVAQRHIPDVIRPVAPLEHIFDGQLGGAVGVGGLGAVALLDGLLFRLAVGGGRRGKDDIFYAVSTHGRKQRNGSRHVIPVVFEGLPDAFAHEGAGGKIDDAVDVVFGKDTVEEGGIPQVADIKLTRAPHRLTVPRLQVVGHDDIIAAAGKQHHHVTADIAGTAGHQNGFHMFPPYNTLRMNLQKAVRPSGVHL